MEAPFCARASIAAEEGLFGSAAADTDVWIVIQYDKPWDPKPLGPSEIPEPVKERITRWLDEVPRSRLQLIRSTGPDEHSLRVFIGHSRERDPWLLGFSLARYEDLLELDLDAIVAEGTHPRAEHVAQPLQLVCTHGKRDRCCAKWGVPLYRAMSELEPDHTWQTTHTGGHRFAANVVMLPYGISYGRLEPDDAQPLLEAHRRGELYDLDRLRGRSCHSAPAQAAEYFLRRQTGLRGLEALRLLATEHLGEAHWRVTFAMADGEQRAVELVEEQTGHERPKSCGDSATPATRFRLA